MLLVLIKTEMSEFDYNSFVLIYLLCINRINSILNVNLINYRNFNLDCIKNRKSEGV